MPQNAYLAKVEELRRQLDAIDAERTRKVKALYDELHDGDALDAFLLAENEPRYRVIPPKGIKVRPPERDFVKLSAAIAYAVTQDGTGPEYDSKRSTIVRIPPKAER